MLKMQRPRVSCKHRVVLSWALACAIPASAMAVPVTTDLWDIAQGTIVTANSPTRPDSDITNMFGGAGGTLPLPDLENTLFEESRPVGTVHFVEWATSTLVEIDQVNLWASTDGADERAFSQFILYADGVQVIDFSPAIPYIYPGEFGLLLSHVFATTVTASTFRAEFVQARDTFPSGPRVWELDAFGRVAVPEPGIVVLIGLGLAGVGMGLRRRKSGQ